MPVKGILIEPSPLSGGWTERDVLTTLMPNRSCTARDLIVQRIPNPVPMPVTVSVVANFNTPVLVLLGHKRNILV